MLDKTKSQWYPMRISYSNASRLIKLQEKLNEETSVEETFVPMIYKQVDMKMELAPAIDNLIFIRTKYSDLSVIKENKSLYEPLRYIMHPVLEDGIIHSEVLFVPDGQMNDFKRVTAEQNDRVVFLNNMEFACKPGTRVQITEGAFAGVKGVVKSFKKHLCVVIPIKDVAAVAITNVPKKHLLYLKGEETDETA